MGQKLLFVHTHLWSQGLTDEVSQGSAASRQAPSPPTTAYGQQGMSGASGTTPSVLWIILTRMRLETGQKNLHSSVMPIKDRGSSRKGRRKKLWRSMRKTRQIKKMGSQKLVYKDNCFILGAGCPKALGLNSASPLWEETELNSSRSVMHNKGQWMFSFNRIH